jgi:hypothetical protein
VLVDGGEVRRWMVSEGTMTEKDARAKQKAIQSANGQVQPLSSRSSALTRHFTHHRHFLSLFDEVCHSIYTMFFHIPI